MDDGFCPQRLPPGLARKLQNATSRPDTEFISGGMIGYTLEDERLEHVLMEVWFRSFFRSKWVICRFHVNLLGCMIGYDMVCLKRRGICLTL